MQKSFEKLNFDLWLRIVADNAKMLLDRSVQVGEIPSPREIAVMNVIHKTTIIDKRISIS